MYNKQEEVFIFCFFTKEIKMCEKSLKKLSYNERRKRRKQMKNEAMSGVAVPTMREQRRPHFLFL
jgi:hypothetical protein